MSKDHRYRRPAVYQIILKGSLDPAWSAWFGGLSIAHEIVDGQAVSVLTGQGMDQAALHGVLGKIRDMNLEILAITQMSRQPD